MSREIEGMLPALMGTLALLARQATKIIDPAVKNSNVNIWERVLLHHEYASIATKPGGECICHANLG